MFVRLPQSIHITVIPGKQVTEHLLGYIQRQLIKEHHKKLDGIYTAKLR